MINLLPPQYKEELRKERRFYLLVILEVIFFFFLISLTLVLFSIKIDIAAGLEEQKVIFESASRQFSYFKPIKERVDLTNKEVSIADSFYKNQYKPTLLVEKISALLPKGVYLTSLSYEKKTMAVNLAGFSPTVDALLEFRDNIRSQEEFEDVSFPIILWMQPADINFNISLKIKR